MATANTPSVKASMRARGYMVVPLSHLWSLGPPAVDRAGDPAYDSRVVCIVTRAMLLNAKPGVVLAAVALAAAAILAALPARFASIAARENAPEVARALYAVNQSAADRGTISVYVIDRGHSLIKVIRTVANVNDVKGVAASAATGKLYVAYRTSSAGMIYCLDLSTDAILWNKAVDPDVDRLSIHPDGRLLY